MNWSAAIFKSLLCRNWEGMWSRSILFYHLIHKVPSFLEFIISKSEYAFLPSFCSADGEKGWSVELLYRSNQLGDEQLYLFLTILLAFSQVLLVLFVHSRRTLHSWIVCSRSLPLRLLIIPSSPIEPTREIGRSAAYSWFCLSVCSPSTSIKRTYVPNLFLCNILGLLSPFLDYGRSLQHASASRRSRHVGPFSLRS